MHISVSIEKQLASFKLSVRLTAENEILALLGASGSGKSMTLKCIAGLETPDTGYIAVDGRVLYDSAHGISLPPQERRMGYLFQSYALFPHMTVAENILFGAKRDKQNVLEENLRRFHLASKRAAYPGELSGGERQRTALARILASGAELLLLDEPFSALDGHLRFSLGEELSEIAGAMGGAFLVTHDPQEACRMAGRVAVLSRGRVAECRTANEFFERPETLAGARLAGVQNITKIASLRDGRVQLCDWGIVLPAPPGGMFSHAAVSAAHVVLVEREEQAEDAETVCGRVLRFIEEPQSRLAVLETAEGRLYLQVEKETDVLVGEQLKVRLPREHICFLKE